MRQARSRQTSISTSRKTAFYVGTCLSVVGIVLFVSVFVSGIAKFGDFQDLAETAKSLGLRAVLGFGLIIGGGVVRGLGAHGLAGSGVVLDPDQAREDLAPYSRMAGGMVKDGLDAANIDLGQSEPIETVKVRCQACRSLEIETAKFCSQCGKPI
jgi:hypothetical protein